MKTLPKAERAITISARAGGGAPFALPVPQKTVRSRRPRWIDPFEPREIRRLVAEFGSPLIILDCERVRQQYRQLARALPGVLLHYALKPMPHPSVVRTVYAMGGNLDLATTGELELVARMGLDP
ncbi:MAG: hypothetical protein NZM12_01610, partial [Steroidobacteraceae bacterium]|nr:hypothetical protein [Steroidobacteraceae bacterium]MDW8260704.1 hypothetical protein [Gammaproteobacteria bacterium]